MPQSRNNGYQHFLWATWNREPLLTVDKEAHAYDLIRRQCDRLKTPILALNGMPDHVHLLVKLPTTLCVADFMEMVKGSSARAINDAYGSPTFAFKWQSGYNYDAVSVSHIPRVLRYIECQKQHHADGTLWPSAELPEPDSSTP